MSRFSKMRRHDEDHNRSPHWRLIQAKGKNRFYCSNNNLGWFKWWRSLLGPCLVSLSWIELFYCLFAARSVLIKFYYNKGNLINSRLSGMGWPSAVPKTHESYFVFQVPFLFVLEVLARFCLLLFVVLLFQGINYLDPNPSRKGFSNSTGLCCESGFNKISAAYINHWGCDAFSYLSVIT